MNGTFRLTGAAFLVLLEVAAAWAGNKEDCLQDHDPALAAVACPLYQAELEAARQGTTADAQSTEAAKPEPAPEPEAPVMPVQNWLLNPESSSISITSTKAGTTTETHFFRTLDGSITDSGSAIVTIDLSSLDTSIDIRNVRMRFLFFETFKYPRATITANLDLAKFANMAVGDTVVLNQPVMVDLHGVTKELTVSLVAIRISENVVKVVSTEPARVPAADFDLGDGIARLSEAASGVEINPVGTVAFDLSFEGGTFSEELMAARAAVETNQAMETTRVLTAEECQNRMEVISQTRAIYFTSGSHVINEEQSAPVLNEVAQFFNRCPDTSMLIVGHTDSVGGDDYNMGLSDRRAASVAQALYSREVGADRIVTAGSGETEPVADNTTETGRAKNRRIEFRPAR